MGFTRTKFDDAQFDVDKFDYSLDSDTFHTEVVDDVDEILLENGNFYILLKEVEVTDGMGAVKSMIPVQYQIYGLVQPITHKDWQIHTMGLAVPGNMKIYLKGEYSVTSAGVEETYRVNEGDVIIYSDAVRWRVEKILGERQITGTTSYISAVIKSIDLEGT